MNTSCEFLSQKNQQPNQTMVSFSKDWCLAIMATDPLNKEQNRRPKSKTKNESDKLKKKNEKKRQKINFLCENRWIWWTRYRLELSQWKNVSIFLGIHLGLPIFYSLIIIVESSTRKTKIPCQLFESMIKNALQPT